MERMILWKEMATIAEKSASTKTKVLRYIKCRQSALRFNRIDKLKKIKHRFVKFTV